MTNSEIKQILINKGVQHLYHTNTVETSLSFLINGGLLSRGFCIDMGFPQTDQYTDISDRQFNVFYDIFFDSIEIQARTGVSYYGPILFVYSIDVIDIVEEGHILITKMNPDKWRPRMSIDERYFLERNELSLLFTKGDFGQHITLINQRQPLPFDYLEKIVLSNPQQDDNSLYDVAKATIEQVLSDKMINVPFEIRNYNYNERFFETYSNSTKLQKHFGLGGYKK